MLMRKCLLAYSDPDAGYPDADPDAGYPDADPDAALF